MTNDVVHMGRLWKDGAYTEPGRWVKAEDYERLEADAAGVQAELASAKECWAEALENVATRNREIERLQARVTRYQGRCDALAILHYGPDPNAPEPRAAHAQLLTRVPRVKPDFVAEIQDLPREELERRVIIQKDWLEAHAQALDGLGLKVGVEGCRLPKDIRRAFEQLPGAALKSNVCTCGRQATGDHEPGCTYRPDWL